MRESTIDLIRSEGWPIVGENVKAFGKEFPIRHPCLIYLELYRTETNPDLKYQFMKAAHDYLWPHHKETWHYWTELRFREHCRGKNYIGWAGGASTAKSMDSAKVALIFWFASPKKRGVIIASTTLAALESRVWGYIVSLLNSRAVKIPVQYIAGNSPKILSPADRGKGEIKDSVHGIFAVAARQGSDESAINTWIGRHPEDALLLVLDECTDLNLGISKAFINLDSSEKPFQCIGIGNSSSWFDLHGMLCYPKDGIESINPDEHRIWETTQKNGICLFFDCYDSPAIHEPDPKKRKALAKFLITAEQIAQKEKQYGKDSDQFFRFVRGFWRSKSGDKTIVSRPFLDAHKVDALAEWLGLHPITMVAGLDPAFSSGGDSCILQLGMLGQTVDGDVVLDFRDEKLQFNIEISAKVATAVEIQIAQKVNKILGEYGIPLKTLCVDANGQGRALGGTLQLQANSLVGPTKIYSVRSGDTNEKSFDVKIMESYELWSVMRTYIENNQVRGVCRTALHQLVNRLVITEDANGKPCKPRLENKVLYKRRMGGIMPSLAHSPDEADAVCLALQSAIIHYGFKIGQKLEMKVDNSFESQKLRQWKAEQREKATVPSVRDTGLKNGFGSPVTDFRKAPLFPK